MFWQETFPNNVVLTEMYNLRRKGAPGSGIELTPVFKETNRLKKSLMLNGINGVVTSGKDPSHPSLQLVKKN